jgi:GT2 family glycosyltransferase
VPLLLIALILAKIFERPVQPKLAIVILNWNGSKYLRQFLPSVLASTYSNKEIIIADNGSTDNSIQVLSESFPQVTIIELGHNYGFATGYNLALKQVSADYYALLNSDVEVNAGWLEPIIELMEKSANIGACQPKLLSYTDRKSFEYAGACGGWLDHFGYPFARGRIFDFCEKDEGQYEDACAVFWASGAALIIRAKLFHEVGGLDGYFFAHQEEIDLCWRLQLSGYSIFVCPSSVVYHLGGGTLPKGNERKVFLNFRNNLIMLAKNLPLGRAVWTIPVRILLDMISGWKSLLSGEVVYFAAIAEAHLALGKWILFKSSQSVFPKDRKGKLQGWFGSSIVWRHFILGKKTFRNIIKN